MRFSTANSYNTSLDSLVNRQANLSATQEQMTTGKRVNRASDDPGAAARSERALASERRGVASQRAVDASSNAMTMTESALADAGNLLNNARESLVTAGNGTYSDAERSVISNQLADVRQQLFSVANRTDGAGTYLFGGQGSNQPPFIDAPGGVQFHGMTGPMQAASGEALPLTVDGNSTFMLGRTGNGVFETKSTTSTGTAWIDSGTVTDPQALTGAPYSVQFGVANGATTYSVLKGGAATAQTNLAFTPGKAIQVDGMSVTIQGKPANGDAFALDPSTPSLSVFAALDKAIADLKTPGRSGTQIAQSTAVNLAGLDSVLGQVASSRSQVGIAMNRITDVSDRLATSKLSDQTQRSNAEDLDMTQAISAFSNQQTGYDASLKAYSMVQRLSLFNYLNP